MANWVNADRRVALSRKIGGGSRVARLAFAITLMGLAGVADSGRRAQAQAVGADSPPLISEESGRVRHVTITLYKSRTIKINQPFETAVVGQPDIADVLPLTDSSVYIQGKKVGATNVSIFDPKKRLMAVLDLEVVPDTASVNSKIRASTGGQNIQVSSAGGQVVLSGEASDAVSASRAVAVAKGLSPDAPIVDAMKVASSQQVLLKVRFLEASRNAERDLGVKWSAASNSINNTAAASGQALGSFPGVANASVPFGTVLANFVNHGVNISAQLDALESRGVVRNLAEPDLIALSGDTASFDAGGEIPFPVVQPGTNGGAPTVTIEFKKFGVHLDFVPTVLANGLINLRLHPQVSEIDTTNSVQINGTTVPTLTNREASTGIELRSGQSFAIAGLLQTTNNEDISQVPYLGSVPVLGALFRSTAFQKHETDLVIIVTPSLVKPAAPGEKLATPFDERLAPNDIDLFALGDLEVKKKYTAYVTSGGELKGPYGDIVDAAVAPEVPTRKRVVR